METSGRDSSTPTPSSTLTTGCSRRSRDDATVHRFKLREGTSAVPRPHAERGLHRPARSDPRHESPCCSRRSRPGSVSPRAVGVGGGLERQGRVCVGAARAHLGRDPDRLHQLPLVGTLAQRRLGMALDAVRALGDVGDGNGDQLLGLRVQRAVGEDLLAELLEGVVCARSELLAPLRDLGAGRG